MRGPLVIDIEDPATGSGTLAMITELVANTLLTIEAHRIFDIREV